jgi:hypothetical protein
MAIPSLVTLLGNNYDDIRSATVSALTKFADYGKFVVARYSDIADAGMKSSFAGKLGRPFHCSLHCWMAIALAFNRL